MEDAFHNLAPHKSSFSLKGPRELASTMSIPKPGVNTISNWLESPSKFDPNKWARMQSIAIH